MVETGRHDNERDIPADCGVSNRLQELQACWWMHCCVGENGIHLVRPNERVRRSGVASEYDVGDADTFQQLSDDVAGCRTIIDNEYSANTPSAD
jgi:hypothetical protein